MVRLARFAMCLSCGMPLGTPTMLASQTLCPSEGVAVQVLGSGGPRTGSDRASASYRVWIDGRARVMGDAGGGSFVRFGAVVTQPVTSVEPAGLEPATPCLQSRCSPN